MRIITGNLIDLALAGHFDVIVHGCNCQHTMGAGIAKAIRQTFPEAYQADLRTVKGSREKMGAISVGVARREKGVISVVNGYTQFDWRGNGVKVDYEAVRAVMFEVKNLFAGARIGYPMIGAGLARGDWGVISRIIDDGLAGEDHALVVLPS